MVMVLNSRRKDSKAAGRVHALVCCVVVGRQHEEEEDWGRGLTRYLVDGRNPRPQRRVKEQT